MIEYLTCLSQCVCKTCAFRNLISAIPVIRIMRGSLLHSTGRLLKTYSVISLLITVFRRDSGKAVSKAPLAVPYRLFQLVASDSTRGTLYLPSQ